MPVLAFSLRQPDLPTAQDIFRKYPHQYEGIIPTLCSNLEELDEPEAKAALIWMLGEYAEKIDNVDELLSTFLETFAEDPFMVCRKFIWHQHCSD